MKNQLHSFQLLLVTFLFCSLFSYSQDTNEYVLDNFSDYTAAPREIAYSHLNKSTYIEGEMLGFTAYVFDMNTKEPSQSTQNLYCTISDDKGNVLKKKLLKLKNGVASNIFEIDSTLSTGIFTFKAYTNWMRNFREKSHFEQTFKVIDADNKDIIKPLRNEDLKIDLQLLGEGGHILYDVPNTIGVIAKDQFNKGIANAKGRIIDNEGTLISEFQLNNVGIAKTLFTPQVNRTYSAELTINDRVIKTEISNIQVLGLAMTLVERGDKVTLKIETNKQTKKQLKNKVLTLSLHDGSDIQATEFTLNDQGRLIISYPIESLFTGINVFTIFNEDRKPLLERLYFNLNGLKSEKIESAQSKVGKDSVDVKLSLNNINPSKFSNLSISVLPTGTKSYNQNNTLLSQLYIQPYIKGALQNSKQYFETITNETKYNLDLLMLTQGWSSYDWNSVFNYDDTFLYPFERGIDIVANINGDQSGTYVVYPLAENNTQLFEIPEKEKEFTIKNIFPNDDDLFRIGYLDTKKKEFSKKPSVYLQFYPSEFPNFASETAVINEVYIQNDIAVNGNTVSKAFNRGEQLKEVVVEGKTKYTRAEELANKAINSRVDIIDENIKLRGIRLDLYLQRLGWSTQFDYFSGTLSITNPRVNWGSPVPLVYLDGALLNGAAASPDFSLLTFLTMADVEYIEYEWYGFGGGIRGAAGFIKIKTDPNAGSRRSPNNIMTYNVPLRFEKEKKFYAPKYQYYNTAFFKEYGTIDWKPNLKIDANGNINFKVLNTGSDSVSLFIEGIVNDASYISEEVIIETNN